MEEWKSKTSKMQEELAKVQAEYREMERKVGIIELIMMTHPFVNRLRRAEK